MVEEKITLDKDVFKALTSETRIAILKSLMKRRKTLSELSKELGMSFSTVKEHLDSLVEAGLIEQKDEGYKWKYYELTKKGKAILYPEDKKIWILIGFSLIGIVILTIEVMKQNIATLGHNIEIQTTKIAKEIGSSYYSYEQTLPLTYIYIVAILILGFILTISLIYIVKKRKFSYFYN